MLDSQTFFTDVLKSIELSCSQVLELLQAHENSSCSRIDAQSYRLQQEVIQLHKKQEELQRLDVNQDPASFLNASTLILVSQESRHTDVALSAIHCVVEVYEYTLYCMHLIKACTVEIEYMARCVEITYMMIHDTHAFCSQSKPWILTEARWRCGLQSR